jgi:AraC-like DNA-binding protein/quercetin dioxygenase-like cupin family protein
MSRDGQERPAAVAFDLAAGEGFDWHSHPNHQLALAATGTLVMAVDDTAWVLPPSRALWIPAGITHSVSTDGATRMLSVYFAPDQCPLDWERPTVVDASGLFGELAGRLVRTEIGEGERRRAEAVLWDLMRPAPAAALTLPLPRDERARLVAEGILADVTDERPLAAWGREVGASARTLARLFVAETGLTFARWRTNARLAAALRLLAAGEAVGTVAHRVGYGSPSAFVAAFRRGLGTTPAKAFRPG